ncbi:hypothetical protein RBA21_000182 [Cronobacter dublinensis]|nr:hypothetical protein [Cronobacter dublinensis]
MITPGYRDNQRIIYFRGVLCGYLSASCSVCIALFRLAYLRCAFFQTLILNGLGWRAKCRALDQQHAVRESAYFGEAKAGRDQPIDLAHLCDGLAARQSALYASCGMRRLWRKPHGLTRSWRNLRMWQRGNHKAGAAAEVMRQTPLIGKKNGALREF